MILHLVESRLFSRKTRSHVTFHYRTSELYNHDGGSRVSSEKHDSERRFSRSLARRLSPPRLGYIIPSDKRAERTSTAATGMRSTAVVVGFLARGPVFIPGNARLGSHRLTAAGIDSCTFLFRPFRILPGVVDVTSRPRVPRNAPRFVPRAHFIGARTRRIVIAREKR